MVYSTVIVAHTIDAEGPEEAAEAAWLWANRQPPEWEVTGHSVNFRRELHARDCRCSGCYIPHV